MPFFTPKDSCDHEDKKRRAVYTIAGVVVVCVSCGTQEYAK